MVAALWGPNLNDNIRDFLVKGDAWLARHPKSALVIPYITGIAIWAGFMFTFAPEGTMILPKWVISPRIGGD